jgi:hypothetical protein
LGRFGDWGCGLPIPGQQVGDAVALVICDPGEDIAQVSLGVETVKFGAFDQ